MNKGEDIIVPPAEYKKAVTEMAKLLYMQDQTVQQMARECLMEQMIQENQAELEKLRKKCYSEFLESESCKQQAIRNLQESLRPKVMEELVQKEMDRIKKDGNKITIHVPPSVLGKRYAKTLYSSAQASALKKHMASISKRK